MVSWYYKPVRLELGASPASSSYSVLVCQSTKRDFFYNKKMDFLDYQISWISMMTNAPTCQRLTTRAQEE